MQEVKLVKTYSAYIEDGKLHVEGIENYGDTGVSTLVLDLEKDSDFLEFIVDFIEANTDEESGLIIRIQDEGPKEFEVSESDYSFIFDVSVLTVFAHRTAKTYEEEIIDSNPRLYVI